MSPKVASRDLYRLLRDGCGGSMKALGFTRLAGTSLGWTRREADQALSVWFQADRNGWEDGFGSRFTFEFQLGHEAAVGAGRLDQRHRYFHLLDAGEAERVRGWNDDVLAGLPRFAANPALEALLKDLLPAVAEAYVHAFLPSAGPYPPGLDVWLHYHDPADVERWATWIAEAMPVLSARFLDAVRPANVSAA